MHNLCNKLLPNDSQWFFPITRDTIKQQIPAYIYPIGGHFEYFKVIEVKFLFCFNTNVAAVCRCTLNYIQVHTTVENTCLVHLQISIWIHTNGVSDHCYTAKCNYSTPCNNVSTCNDQVQQNVIIVTLIFFTQIYT